MPHTGRGDQIAKGLRWIGLDIRIVGGHARETTAGRFPKAGVIDLLHLLHHLEKTCPAGYPVSLQRRGYGQADGLLRAGSIRHDQVGEQRIEPAGGALYGCVE